MKKIIERIKKLLEKGEKNEFFEEYFKKEDFD